jgi:penicillin-binding protein 1A
VTPPALEAFGIRSKKLLRQLRERLSVLFNARWGRGALAAVAAVSIPSLLLAAGLLYHVYLDRGGLPDLDAFIRFELPTIGEVHDAKGTVLIELAREYRRVVTYEEMPPVLRQAILATEDKNFFTHSGIDYGSLPRVVEKTALHTLSAWWRNGPSAGIRFPQGGSTLTQQLVRGYFLQDRMRGENGGVLSSPGWTWRLASCVLGVPATNKLARKLEEIRLTLWLEDEMRHRYGSQLQAKREILARYASLIYLGHSRYGFAAASEYYFGKPLSSYDAGDAGKAALLAGIAKSPRDYAPVAGDLRSLRRRNEILALMERNGYIAPEIAKRCTVQPIRLVAHEPIETPAPAAIDSVFDEIREHGGKRFNVDDLVAGRISVKSTVDGRIQAIVNEERGADGVQPGRCVGPHLEPADAAGRAAQPRRS